MGADSCIFFESAFQIGKAYITEPGSFRYRGLPGQVAIKIIDSLSKYQSIRGSGCSGDTTVTRQ